MSGLIVSTSPHIRAKTDTRALMLDVILALVPTLIASALIFGMRALLVAAVTVGAALLGCWAWRASTKGAGCPCR